MPELGLAPGDDIRALDLAVDERGDLHLVWNATLRAPAGAAPRHRTYYSHGRGSGEEWSPPAALDDGPGAPRLLLDGARLDLVTGLHLRHLVSADGGATWQRQADLLPSDRRRAASFDAALVGDELIVVCLLRPDPPYDAGRRGPEHRQELLLVRRAAGGGTTSRTLALLPPSMTDPPAPRLLVDGRRLDLAVAVTADEGRRSASGDGRREAPSRLFHLFSQDGGAGWSALQEIALATAAGSPATAERAIQDLELFRSPAALYLFFTGAATFVTRSVGGGPWSGAVAINPYDTTMARGEVRSTALAAAGAGPRGRVVWVDHRFRRSDRRWWNPLGGLPWSDDSPLWANNDVFTLDISQVDEILGGRAIAPLRLSAPLSFARALRARAAPGGRTIVLWSGRSRVEKEERLPGEPAQIFFVSLPDDRGAAPGVS